ncbi:tripartite tricarboxylate transporter substrate binding protein [Polynucleobacter sp. AP-Capit-er-40B-B4]|uniref:Bug family tripartite tricarboxylate transporter substrate binding protein n=1 Tax=Polynucleobacter sp. AP-Capit-er-40B-B4 TaxID=2576927 RepID=UPI001C0B114B|nr:tripartite tricarboxylate transporter substrate binding protein [Polynucleobacter sp. AP-Capit-er-40B-B4]MBU3580956.1 tripartite tricarboxylate transporter substrate binding protein [Polynucleobacter sp. AP-Capit-er-40B-B4]
MFASLIHEISTSTFGRCILAVGLACGVSLSYAQNYPNRTVKMVVPLTTGSGADIAGRVVAKSLSETWKQSVIIENRPGAGGLIGTGVVVNAEPDGYTLLVQSASYAANPAIYKKLPYDPLKSLVDVAILGQTPYVMITAADSPYQSIRDLVIAAKSKPNEITFASAGVGSSTHLAAEYFNQIMGIKLIHVPYKGSPEAIADTMSGRTAFYMAPLDTAIGQLKGGKVRALGVTSKTRNAAVPDIPSVAEQGYANFEIGLWFGVWAPAATPPAIVKKINQDINQAMQDPEVKTAYETKGIKATPMNPAEFAKFVREEMGKYQKIAKEAAIEPQ